MSTTIIKITIIPTHPIFASLLFSEESKNETVPTDAIKKMINKTIAMSIVKIADIL